MLCAAVSAVVTGARSLIAMSEWITDAPQHVLGVLGFAADSLTGRRPLPHAATVRRDHHFRSGHPDRRGRQDVHLRHHYQLASATPLKAQRRPSRSILLCVRCCCPSGQPADSASTRSPTAGSGSARATAAWTTIPTSV
ncbi:hypothetical protein ACIQ6K_35290 [Streptomyces sp. NPDC096354]|uniref:hypothetical protein n=1 Tax=Streptomyces sp. NPDC096354 TaxID=3366088 RepID=UPI00382B81A8